MSERSVDTETTDNPNHPRYFLIYLMITAVIAGAMVMVIEVLGSRVIGPFFGVSLFVWTSLITVTLMALAGGYAVGGMMADRNGRPDRLYFIILLAGGLALCVPLLKNPVLQATVPLGLRGGTFFSTLLLFGPSLFLLGCVSPFLVKIAAREIRSIGKTVGGLYALSTLGSVAGTLLTGFFLIGYLGVNRIFQVVGALLIVLAVGYFLFFRRKWLALAAMAFPLLLPLPENLNTKLMDNGTRYTVIEAADSFYGNLKVIDYTYRHLHTRELVIDGLIQGGLDMRSDLSIYAYSYLMQLVPYALNPEGKRGVALGLGPGIVPRWYEQRGVAFDVVEIDPKVVDLAKRYFAFINSGTVEITDARRFIDTNDSAYDYVILDIFNGDTTPAHVLSLEALERMAKIMNANGVLAINLSGSVRDKTYITASVFRTLKNVYDNVVVYPTFDTKTGPGFGNLIVVAYNGEPRTLDTNILSQYQIHPFAREIVERALRQPLSEITHANAIVLTDDYSPIDFFDAWLRESVRRTIIETTDWDALIN